MLHYAAAIKLMGRLQDIWHRLLGTHCLGFAMIVAATSSMAQTRPEIGMPASPPASALHVGNSLFYYNNSMHEHVNLLIRGARITVPFRST
jgi:hypothetical protein